MVTKSFSIEDGNLNQASLITSRSRDYVDVDLAFDVNNVGDLYKKNDAAAVKQSVKNIILTTYYEKPFKPLYGSNIRELLFELFETGLAHDVDLRIRGAIQRWEPRAKVERIDVKPLENQNALFVNLYFSIVNTDEQVELNVTVTRLR
jgi:phage baseplate assembly protein W